MKKRIVSVLLAICVTTVFAGCSLSNESKTTTTSKTSEGDELFTLGDLNQEYGDTFGQGNIIDVNIDISDEDWQAMLGDPTAEEYHSANVTVNGTEVDNVGIRTKGFSSLTSVANSDSDRYGFHIKMDKYVDDQNLNGLDNLILNASFSDASYMREYMTYAAMAYLGGTTPYISYTNLYVNGELFGFYLSIEGLGDSFIDRNTTSEDACLYKADSENCTLLESDDTSGFDVKGDDDDCTNIKNLIQVLNNTTEDNKEELENILDVDSVLKAIAINTVTGNYDSYSGSKAHNYYLLYDNGKFNYIGWDYNMSMGGFSEDNGASVTVDITDPIYNTEESNRPLIEKLLAIDEYYNQYIEYVNKLVDYFDDFQSMVDNYSNKISEYVENDPSTFYTYDQFLENTTASDTDLSEVTPKTGGGPQGGGQMPEGMQQGEMPSSQGNEQMQIQERGQAANGEAGESASREKPEGMQDGQMPADGEMKQGGRDMKQGGGNMISNETVSIVDYITQRIANIKSQLGE